jgi:hypothetical protein
MSGIHLLDDLVGGLDNVFVDILSRQLSSADRLGMAEKLKDWLATVARVKPVADLQSRMERINKRFDQLAESSVFSVVGGEIVVKAPGENEDTLKMLENGTDWFDPCKSVVNVMISALWKS